MNKQELIEKLLSSRQRLEAAVGRLSVEQLTRPGACGGFWSVKDVMGHVVHWEKDLLEGYELLKSGKPVPEYSDGEIDEINARVRWSTFTLPLEEVLAEFRRSHQQVRDWLADLPEAELERPYAYGRTLGQFIPVDTWEHYEEHALMVERVDQ